MGVGRGGSTLWDVRGRRDGEYGSDVSQRLGGNEWRRKYMVLLREVFDTAEV